MMNDTKQQVPSGLERFSHLEDKIFRMVEEFRAIRRENDGLRAENQKLRQEIGELRSNEGEARNNLVQFQKEREELKERVEKALSLLASLEARDAV